MTKPNVNNTPGKADATQSFGGDSSFNGALIFIRDSCQNLYIYVSIIQIFGLKEKNQSFAFKLVVNKCFVTLISIVFSIAIQRKIANHIRRTIRLARES